MTRPTVRVRFLPPRGERPIAEVVVPAGTWLTAAAARAGVGVVHDCDGLGLCGTCAVRVAGGAAALPPVAPAERIQLDDRIADGWRLCCLVRVYGDVTIRLPEPGFAYRPELQRGEGSA